MNTAPSLQFANAAVGGGRPPPLPAHSAEGKRDGQPIRVLICDDHPMIVSGMTAALAGFAIEVVGEVSASTEIVAAYAALAPDVVILDIRYQPGTPTGLDIAVALKKQSPAVRIVFYSQFDSDEMIKEAYRLRCSGFVTKNSPLSNLVDAITRAHGGKPYFLPDIAERLALLGLHGDNSPQAKLEPREFEIFKQLAAGVMQEEIGTQLGLSQKTISIATRSIREKLGITRTVDFTLLAVKHHIISVE